MPYSRLLLALTCVFAFAAASPASALDLTGTTSFGGGGFPRIAALPDGGAIAVWYRGPEIMSATRSDDGTWGPSEVAAANASPRGAQPLELAVDAAGNATVVWMHNSEPYPIMTIEKTAGGAWTEVDEIYTPGVGELVDFTQLSSGLSLAVNPSGDLAVAFRGYAATFSGGECEPGVDYQCNPENEVAALGRKPAGSTWHEAIRLSSRSGWEEVRATPALALDRAGNATVAWHHGRDETECLDIYGRPFWSIVHSVQARSVTNEGILQPLEDVDEGVCGGVSGSYGPDVAVDWFGNRTIVFDQTGTGGKSLRVTKAAPGSSFPDADAIWENTTEDGIDDSTAVNGALIGIAAHDATTSNAVIIARQHTPNAILAFTNTGSGWSNPTKFDGFGFTTVKPTFDRFDNAYLAWNASDYVRGAVRRPGGAWSDDDLSIPHGRATFGDQSGVADLAGSPVSASADFIWQDAAGTLRARRIGGGSLASVAGDTLRYIAGTGQENDLKITDEGDTFRLDDAGGSINVGDGCTKISANAVRCQGLPVSRIHVELGEGDDELYARPTVTTPLTVTGGSGDDTLTTSSGADKLYGEAGTDNLRGLGGDDALDGGKGGDIHDGGDGTDTLGYADRDGPVAVKLDGYRNDGADPDGNGTSTSTEEGDRDVRMENVVGGHGEDRITNNLTATAVLIGGGGNDTLTGGSGSDGLEGGDGDDTLDGRGSADVLNGGLDEDTVTYALRTAAEPVEVTLGDDLPNDGRADVDPVAAGDQSEGDRIGLDVENAIGGSGDDVLIGGPDKNVLDGKAGNDSFDGGDGADVLKGGADTDLASYKKRSASVHVVIDRHANDGQVDADPLLDGAQGERDFVRADVEMVVGGEGDDRLIGTNGDNAFDGKGGNDVLDGRLGIDILEGGLGVDTVTYSSREVPVHVSIDVRANDGEADVDPVTEGEQSEGDRVGIDVENVTGGSGDDILTAWRPDDVVNVLAGGLGADRITTRDGTTTRDRALCGDGTDTAITDASDTRSACEAG